MKSKRIEWIDYLKAFACILVVIGHLIMSLKSIDHHSSITSFIVYFIYLFHMPLFMCISGFLYKKYTIINNVSEYKKFEIKKIINLMIPYIVFYSITMILNMLFSKSVNTPKGINEWIGMINNPIAPYWFLYALASIFIVVPILEKGIKNKYILLLLFALLKVLNIFFKTDIYFIDSIMKNGLFFYLGAFISDKESKTRISIDVFLLILYISLSALIYLLIQKGNYIYEIAVIVMGILGILLFENIFKKVKKSRFLDIIKKYTFQIFLMHTIFAAGLRIIMFKIGIRNYYIHLMLGLFASIYFPILVSMISNKLKITNIVFYPLKTIEEYKKGK